MSDTRVAVEPPIGSASAAPDAHRVMRDYGSAPGELAVCVRHVGVARRHDIAVAQARADPGTLAAVTEQLTGRRLATGGVAHAGGVWWCRPTVWTILVLGTPRTLQRSTELLRTETRRHPELILDPSLERFSVLEVVGHRTIELLRALGVPGDKRDLRDAAPCVAAGVGGTGTVWLLESPVGAICCVDRDQEDTVLHAITAAGRPLGLGWVGSAALERYALLERRRFGAAGAQGI